MKHKLNIKPLSVNQAWQGKRFKTPLYKKYEQDCLFMLPNLKLGLPPYQINIEVAYSTIAADLDNCIKPMIDILQKKYNFDDKHVYRLVAEKKVVKKGNEYIVIEISGYESLH
jgi:Holliday junction resolvase RusA-like endonuclease